MNTRHFIFPLIMIFIAIISIAIIGQFEQPRFQDARIDAKFFPTTISVAIIIISILLMVQSKFSNISKDENKYILTKMSILGIGFLIAYSLLIYFIGYLISSLIAFTLYLLFFKIKKVSYYLIAWLFVGVVYYLFSYVFLISLPQGSMF